MHTCFSEQSPEATRLGRGRAEGGAGSDPTKVYLAQQQADSRPVVGGVVVVQGAELLKLPHARSPVRTPRTTLPDSPGPGTTKQLLPPHPAFCRWSWSRTSRPPRPASCRWSWSRTSVSQCSSPAWGTGLKAM